MKQCLIHQPHLADDTSSGRLVRGCQMCNIRTDMVQDSGLCKVLISMNTQSDTSSVCVCA